jgi:hypothetical protein
MIYHITKKFATFSGTLRIQITRHVPYYEPDTSNPHPCMDISALHILKIACNRTFNCLFWERVVEAKWSARNTCKLSPLLAS